ncbi:alpha/beta hydrolase [Rhodococcus hoagii]|nr:alpha/beta hydrolase [Prescottella equi]
MTEQISAPDYFDTKGRRVTKSRRREVAVAHTALSYHVSGAGEGTPVVLLHPWFGCWQFWTPVVGALTHRPCYAVDFYSLAGGDWTGVADPSGLADAVIAMMNVEGIGSADVLGNSVGGIVAQILASTHPERVRRLVLVGTGASTDRTLPGFAAAVDRWIQAANSDEAASSAAIEETVGMLFTGRTDPATWTTFVAMVQQTPPDFLAAVLAAARRLDLTPRLGSIAAPTLVIRGSDDCARTRDHAAALVRGIPTAVSAEMPGAGHSPMVDHPADFVALIEAHIDE